MAGRILVVLGLAVAFSALWMTQFYPRHPGNGELAYLFRLAFGSCMAVCIVLGLGAGWAVNLAVAEYVIRRPGVGGPRTGNAPTTTGPS